MIVIKNIKEFLLFLIIYLIFFVVREEMEKVLVGEMLLVNDFLDVLDR